MLRFTINSKDLKELMEKGLSVINKKSPLNNLRRLCLEVDNNGVVKAFGTDTDQFLEVKTDKAWNTNSGIIVIDIDDIKIISRVSGEVTLEDIGTESNPKISVKCGKKTVVIPRYENMDYSIPEMEESKLWILRTTESWLLDTVTKLSLFAKEDDVNKMMAVFNFNTKNKRVEVSDGYRVGMRSLNNQNIVTETNNTFETVKLHVKCLPVFKKILNKKSNSGVNVYQDCKFIRIEGEDFVYVTRRIDGEYFRIDRLLKDNTEFSFNFDKEKMLSIMKYNDDIAKSDLENNKKCPVLLHSDNGKLYSFLKTNKYEIFDEIEADNIFMNYNLFVGFNPGFIVDVLSVVDTDNPTFGGSKENCPVYIEGKEYSFVVMPVNIQSIKEGIIDSFIKHINN